MHWSPNTIYKEYWVARCRYTRNNEQFHGIMTVAGANQSQAIERMRQYFTAHSGQYTFADYEILTPLVTYIEQSSKLALPLVRQVREQHEANVLAVLVDERNLTHPRPSEKGDIHYAEGQPAFSDGVHLYAVIDSGEYHRQTGQHLVPMLHGSQLPWQSLYQGETQDSLEDQAPYLIHLLPNHAGEVFLEHCSSLSNKGTLGIFIHSLKSFTDIHRQLRKMTYLHNKPLNSWNFFRFYDVSHFMPFIESLTHGQLLNVVSGVKAFYGYSANYPDGVKITFHSDYLYDTRPREPLFINEKLYRHYAALTLVQTLNKAKQLIAQCPPLSTSSELSGSADLEAFCLRIMNQAFLSDISQTQALLYYVLARHACTQNETLWQSATEQAKPYEANAVTFNYHRYRYCLSSQGVTP